MTTEFSPQEERVIAYETEVAEKARRLIEEGLITARQLSGFNHHEEELAAGILKKVFDTVDLPEKDGNYTGGIYIESLYMGSTVFSQHLSVRQAIHQNNDKVQLKIGDVCLAPNRYKIGVKTIDHGQYSYMEIPGQQVDDNSSQAELGIYNLLNSLKP